MSLSKTERIDKFGHCCACSEYLLIKRIVDGRVVDMFTPQYDQTIFLLNTGSQMQITICKKCKETLDLNDPVVHAEIMAAVMKGWELETAKMVEDEALPNYTEELRGKELENFSKLSINCNSEELDKYAVQCKVIELANLKVEEISETSEIEVEK